MSNYEWSQGAEEDKKPKQRGNYLIAAMFGLLVTLIWETFWPDVIPFTPLGLWMTKGHVLDWLYAALPLFAWGVGVNVALFAFRGEYARPWGWDEQEPWDIFRVGVLISLWAGVMEEIAFRWLIFNQTIVAGKIGGWMLFGWAGFDLHEWIYLHVGGPLVNATTFGLMAPYLYPATGWAVGAAIGESNAFFRDIHKYQGVLGFVNSWYLGMFFFWVMFNYGLPAAILIHFLYDFFIFSHAAAVAGVRKWRS